MIRKCGNKDLEQIYTIINDASKAYKGVIPEDCWKVPYMSRQELNREINSGVSFWGYEKDGELLGVMGIQDILDVTLIRHAYIRTSWQRRGIGTKLLGELLKKTNRPTLVGTWADAVWAIRFYEKHGFQLVPSREKDRLLRKYWSIPERQVEVSVVLADERWFSFQETKEKSDA